MSSVFAHVDKNVPLAIFEDCGQEDGTRDFLRSRNKAARPNLMAVEHRMDTPREFSAFLGTDNLGVAGNSNRALKWFMDETQSDHLMLCNDDLEFFGDASSIYGKAHVATSVDLFCFCDFTSPQYKCTPITYRGVALKKLSRMTGIMMSITRKLVESIGYFDPQFGRFGEEHCDYTVRARYAGHQNLYGIYQYCLDVERVPIRHQVVASTITPEEKPGLDHIASAAMSRKTGRYPYTSGFIPFSLMRCPMVDAVNSVGTEVDLVSHHHVIV